ncbi:MAG: hypothetical protein PHT33_08315 [bacterium]|nr:hypothetical protein [bacterium]
MSIESRYYIVLNRLMTRIDEPAPGRIQMLTGPRQVSKTTILLEIVRKWGKGAVEIKTGGYTAGDLSGLLEFSRRWPEYRPLVICDDKHADTAQRIGIDCLTWREFLWDGIIFS